MAFAQALIYEARQLYIDDNFGLALEDTVYALDSSTIDLCLWVFTWGSVPADKGCYQVAHLIGSAG